MNQHDLARHASNRHHSQCGEAGVIDRIIELVGHANRVAVEFGGGDGYSLSNTRHLAARGWRVVMFDGMGDGELVHREFITAENINELFRKYDVPEQPDVLSIDLDGNDYWVWKALTATPRLVVAEFNAAAPPGQRRTVPYDPEFRHDGTDYYGASFALLVDLARDKGYTPVFQLQNLNVFFLRDDLLPAGKRSTVHYAESHYHPPDVLNRPWAYL